MCREDEGGEDDGTRRKSHEGTGAFRGGTVTTL